MIIRKLNKNYFLFFLFIFFNLNLIECKRGKRINIYKQSGGDITQLRSSSDTKMMTDFNYDDNSRNEPMRNALPSDSKHKWTVYTNDDEHYVVPYIVTGEFDSEEHSIILNAMRAIENNTCIRFVPKTNQDDFLDFQNKRNQGCYTTVGRQSGVNVVMLEANNVATCVEHDIVIHEIFHSLGLWHEHMRYDRDKYIKVHYENIETGYYPQFEKIPPNESTDYGVTYDYRSVMHYAKDAFSIASNMITMETLNPMFSDIIGHVGDAAVSDYLKICSIYQCKRCMNKDFNNDTINNYEQSIRSTTNKPSTTTRGNRIISSTELIQTTVVDPSTTTTTKKININCSDKFFCSTILNAWNKDFMCQLRSISKWCCLTCKGNNLNSSWFRFGVAD